MDEKIIAIETKVAYQDKTIMELNEIVIAQQNELSLIKKELVLLNQKIEAMGAGAGVKPLNEEEPPPHY